MTQEMKLLHALCEALGFEVETTLDYMERREPAHTAIKDYNTGHRVDRVLASEGPHNRLTIDTDGSYTSLLISPIVDYKLTKKANQ